MSTNGVLSDSTNTRDENTVTDASNQHSRYVTTQQSKSVNMHAQQMLMNACTLFYAAKATHSNHHRDLVHHSV